MRIDLRANNLSGSLPTDLGNLNRLNRLHLYTNSLTGSLPASLGKLTGLQQIYLQSNELTGAIPAKIGNLHQLTKLRLENNSLSGAIPATIGQLAKLTELRLTNNRLGGSIPAEFGDLAALTTLDMSYVSELMGPLPLTLSALSNLSRFLLHGSDGEICVPSALATWYTGVSVRTTTLPACQAGLLLSANPVEPSEGGQQRFWVALGTQPSATVTATVTTTGDSDITASPTTLTFTTSDYGAAQSVTVSAAGDTDSADDLAVLTLTAAGGDYAGRTAAVTAVAVDGDAPKIIADIPSVSVAEGSTATFTVKLATQPTASVTLTAASTGDSDLTANPSTLTFTTTDWGTAQTVTVTAAQDDDKTNDTMRLSWSAAGGDYAGLSLGITVNAVDDDSTAATDRAALTALYNATGGANWTKKNNWLDDDKELKDWQGVTTDASGRVTELSLSRANLTGSLPADIGKLTHLRRLTMYRNSGTTGSLSGSIPAEIGQLTELRDLYLYRNALSGAIPTDIGNLANLVHLHLDHNSLSGAMPTSIGNLSRLHLLYLYQNSLTGSIPAEIGNLTRLQRLLLSNNGLSGSIPAEIGNLTQLNQITLSYNDLSGSIPTEIGRLARLELLFLHENDLTGSIPTQIGNLTRLDYLYLDDNALSGAIPAEIGNLTRLRYLYLDNNDLSGAIPAQLETVARLRRLGLSGNDLSGPIPTWIDSLSNLDLLYLHGNRLSGSIPAQIGNLAALKYLVLGRNPLSGSIPASLGSLADLRWLYLRDVAGLVGPLPASLSGLTKLERLHLTGSEEGICLPSALTTWHDGIDTAPADLDACGTGLLVSSNPATVPEGGTAQVHVALASVPTASQSSQSAQAANQTTVTVGVTATGDRDITVSPASLTFTASNYGTGQPVTLTAASDIDTTDDVAVVRLSAAGGNYDGTTSAATVVAPDDDDARLVLGASSVTVDEGSTAAYTVKLATQPGTDVTVTPAVTGISDVSVSPSSLTFTAENYNSAQSFTVTAVQDGDAVNDAALITHTAAGGSYEGVTASIGVSVSDDDGTVATDKAALVALYDATDGPNWTTSTSWKTAAALGTWHGVTVDFDGRVTGIDLGSNNLVGTIPAKIGGLTLLETLDLSGNTLLTGSMPAEIGSLAGLTSLDLSGSGLSGSIPGELGNLAQLVALDLSGNSLSGQIPSQIGRLAALTSLDLSSNSLSGTLPAELGELSKLTSLRIDGNSSLGGAIPAQIGSLFLLTDLTLSKNALSGSIPAALGNLTRLTRLWLDGNALTGRVPTSFANLAALTGFKAANPGLCLPSALQGWFTALDTTKRDSIAVCASTPVGGPTGPSGPTGGSSGGGGPRREVDATRIGGTHRYDTAVKLAAQLRSTPRTVVVVSGASYADGLAAAGLSGGGTVPVLLTETGQLSAATAKYITSRNVRSVVVVGGPAAVSDAVYAELTGLGNVTVERIGGATRYETAVKVAERVGTPGRLCGTARRTVFLATGTGYADALSASPLAALGSHPILLTAPDALPDAVASYLADADVDQVVVVGGVAAVSAQVEQQVRAVVSNVTRLDGDDRYETSAEFVEWATSLGHGSTGCFSASDRIALATGEGFADALAASTPLAAAKTPLLLTASDELPAAARAFLDSHGFDDTVSLTIVGGYRAVSRDTETRAVRILR